MRETFNELPVDPFASLNPLTYHSCREINPRAWRKENNNAALCDDLKDQIHVKKVVNFSFRSCHKKISDFVLMSYYVCHQDSGQRREGLSAIFILSLFNSFTENCNQNKMFSVFISNVHFASLLVTHFKKTIFFTCESYSIFLSLQYANKDEMRKNCLAEHLFNFIFTTHVFVYCRIA